MKTCFLILHYNEIELTKRAVDSIVAMEYSEDNDKPVIVIVDNCSPNGSADDLLRLYAHGAGKSGTGNLATSTIAPAAVNEVTLQGNNSVRYAKGICNETDVHIILNGENGGFAKGNNIGYRFIKENLNVDFVVALNNDIVFTQIDFPKRLEEVYKNSEPRFYLAGPDVYTPHIRSHISPLSEAVRTREDTENMINVNLDRISQCGKKWSFVSYTRYLQDKYQGSRLLKIYNSMRKSEYDGALPHDKAAYGCTLNGACLIFDKRYIEENDVLFEERTFLYAEEDFLSYRLSKAGKAIRYCPELVTDHVGQGSSGYTSVNYRQYCDKNIKSCKAVNDALKTYIDYIGQ